MKMEGRDPCNNLLGQDWSDSPFYTMLTNGKGWVSNHTSPFSAIGSPEIITVKRGRKYRLRMISGASIWAIKVNISDHDFEVIAVSGGYVQPARAKAFIASSGERVDVIVEANQPVANYWINVMNLLLALRGRPRPSHRPQARRPHAGGRLPSRCRPRRAGP